MDKKSIPCPFKICLDFFNCSFTWFNFKTLPIRAGSLNAIPTPPMAYQKGFITDLNSAHYLDFFPNILLKRTRISAANSSKRDFSLNQSSSFCVKNHFFLRLFHTFHMFIPCFNIVRHYFIRITKYIVTVKSV